MATAVGRIGHEERLSLVDHLEELRGRLIVSLAVVAVAFGFCFWQNHALLHIINAPLAHETQKQVKAGNGPLGSTYTVQQSARTVATQLQVVVGALERPGSGASAATKASLAKVTPELRGAISHLSAAPQGNKPVTLGIGEPFTTTLGIALIFALILSLPVLLYELYGFLLPAFSPEQQRVATPLMLAIPFLFVVGVLFGYFVVLPAAVRFFQNFNSGEFNVLVQASQVLPLRGGHPVGDGARVPGAGGRLGGHARRDRHDRAATPQSSLRDPCVRRGRRVPAGRCDHAAAGDRAAVPPVRAEPPARQGHRVPRDPTHRGRRWIGSVPSAQDPATMPGRGDRPASRVGGHDSLEPVADCQQSAP